MIIIKIRIKCFSISIVFPSTLKCNFLSKRFVVVVVDDDVVVNVVDDDVVVPVTELVVKIKLKIAIKTCGRSAQK